jgi:hypothetical protein
MWYRGAGIRCERPCRGCCRRRRPDQRVAGRRRSHRCRPFGGADDFTRAGRGSVAGRAARLTLASGYSYRTTDQDTLRSRNRSMSAARQPRASETGDQGKQPGHGGWPEVPAGRAKTASNQPTSPNREPAADGIWARTSIRRRTHCSLVATASSGVNRLARSRPLSAALVVRWRGSSGLAASAAGRCANQRRQRQRAQRPDIAFRAAMSGETAGGCLSSTRVEVGGRRTRRRPVTTWPTVLILCVDDGKTGESLLRRPRPSRIPSAHRDVKRGANSRRSIRFLMSRGPQA